MPLEEMLNSIVNEFPRLVSLGGFGVSGVSMTQGPAVVTVVQPPPSVKTEQPIS